MITQELISRFFNYIPETGELYWKHRDLTYFSSSHYWKIWNTKNEGKKAGVIRKDKSNTYWLITIFRKKYRAHHIVWLLKKGYLPKYLDHINHDGLDNRIENLREVSQQENQKNQKMRKDNSSGATGIHLNKRGKFSAQIQNNKKNYYLGSFPSFEEALNIRKKKEKEFNFHPNHGVKNG